MLDLPPLHRFLLSGPTPAASPRVVSKDAKLLDAAQQFEAMLLQQMLKPMLGHPEEEDAQPLAGGDTMMSFGVESIARALARSGGFGIARQIVRQVSAQHPASPEEFQASAKVSTRPADESERGNKP